MNTALYVAGACLSLEVLVAMRNAHQAKGERLPASANLPVAILFLAFHTLYWVGWSMNPWLPWVSISMIYIPLFLASMAFLVGSTLMTTTMVELKEGYLVVNRNHPLHNLIEKLGVTVVGKSLCGLSWLVAIGIVIIPVVYTCAAIIGCAGGIITCGYTGQNPLKYCRELVKFKGWPDTRPTPQYGPLTYITAASLLWLIYHLVTMITWGVAAWGGVILLGVGIGFLIHWVGFKLSWYYVDKLPKATKRDREDYIYRGKANIQIRLEEHPGVLALINMFWQIFQKKYCPKLVLEKRVDPENLQYDDADSW